MREAIIASSVLIVCIALLRRLCRGRISACLQYALWLIVAVRLIVPGITVMIPNLLPESTFSVISMADKTVQAVQDYAQPEQSVQIDLPVGGLPYLTGTNINDSDRNFPIEDFTWVDFIRDIWYIGMAAAGIWMIAVNFLFMRKLHKNRIKYEYPYEEEFGMTIHLPIYTAKELSSPCLYGMPGRQAIYLPEDVAEDDGKIRHILAHEYCHYKHKDVFWSALRCLLTAVYWFHPLVWLAALLSKQDCELACDEAAIRLLGEEERFAYGKTLVSLITRKTRVSDILCTATTMTAGTEGMKERVSRIAKKPRRLAAVLIPVLVIVGAMVVFTFTQAKEYPEGTYLLEGETPHTVTTSCFQITFPETLNGKVYYRGENGTDIIVYHRDSDREIGRFCMLPAEEAVQLAKVQDVVPIGELTKASPYLRSSNEEETYIMEPDEVIIDENTPHTYVPASEEGADTGMGVPGTDSNQEDTTYILPEEHPNTAAASSGGVDPIPAPEDVEKEMINLPFKSEGDYNAVDINEENHDYTPNEANTAEDFSEDAYETHQVIILPDENIILMDNPADGVAVTTHEYHYPADESEYEAKETNQTYLPSETISGTSISWAEQPYYLYIPADHSDAEESIQAELDEMNRILTEVADNSVTILYIRMESMREVLGILTENRTAYVGDASKTSRIINALPAASGLSFQFLEMDTTTEPDSVMIHYNLQVDNFAQIDSDTYFLEAALMFASIENLKGCNMRITKTQEEFSSEEISSLEAVSGEEYMIVSYDRKQMEKLFGPLYPCSETTEELKELYNKVLKYLSEKN